MNLFKTHYHQTPPRLLISPITTLDSGEQIVSISWMAGASHQWQVEKDGRTTLELRLPAQQNTPSAQSS